MIVNNEDYYYLPGVAKAIKTILGRDDLKKYDVPEVLVGLGYDYETNTIPYQEHGKTISLYRKSSIPELLNMPGNKYKANQLIAKINGRNKGMNVFVSQPNVGRRRPNRKAFVTESVVTDIELITESDFMSTLYNSGKTPKRIVKIYVENGKDDSFVIFDGVTYYNVDDSGIEPKIDQDSINRTNFVAKQLKKSYDKYKLYHSIKISNGKVTVGVDRSGVKFNRSVIDWMDDYGFVYNFKASHEQMMVFDITDPGFAKGIDEDLYEDITDDVLDVAYQLDTEAIIHNLKQIYRHILDKDVVFEVGNISEISGKTASVPCIYPVGRLRQEYPRNSTTLLMFLYDGRLAEQCINILGLLPGEYKASCKGEPCTIVVWEKTSGIYNQGVVFYDDDKDAAEEIVYIKNRV